MTLFFCVLVFATFCAIGYAIWRGYKQRKVYFENLLSFCDHLLVEISFSKNTVLHIIENYVTSYGAPFRDTLLKYKNLIIEKQDITRERIDTLLWKRLKSHEHTVIADFFYELGRHGSFEERQKIESKKVTFDNFFKAALESLKRDASIYLKVFIILGIASVILLL